MSNRKFGMTVVSTLVLASMLLAACGGGAPQTVIVTSPPQIIEQTGVPQIIERTSVVEVTAAPPTDATKRLTLNSGAGDIPSLDPALATDTSSHAVLGVSFLGVTRQNDTDGAPQPAMAKDWEVSEDGLTYTFNLV
jgi:ABC-type transport system substrate-binding protein